MKRVTSRAKISIIGISGLLVAGIAVPSAFGTTEDPNGPSADNDRRRGAELSVTAGGSESAAISRPSDRRGPNTLKTKSVTLTSYDAEDGRAVLTRKTRGGGAGAVDVREGDVIASPPTKSAPAGALVKVKDVASSDDGKTEIRTSRANLTEVFGGAKADGKVPVSPSAWKVDPLVKGLDVERGAAKAGRDANGDNLHLDFDTPLPDGDESDQVPPTQVGGYLDFSPKVDFSYDGHGSSDPAEATASIGVGGDYKAGWSVKGTVAEPDLSRRIPVAEVKAHPVIMVGPVPVVVTVKLTLVLKVQANGRIQVDVQKDVNGTVKVGTRYAKDSGWESDNQADGTTLPGGRADVSGEGELRTALGPEADVSLYDTVGVTAFLGPYLRATAQFSQQTPGGADGRGAWQLHGGLTLESSLYAQLPFVIIGNRPSKRIDFPPITREWFITKGEFPAAS
ncbi:hypothetical protein G4Z16_12765 [Streptomyces bathyalis]|uniref:Uncharacterized protein n=1 Tax=Streptomyces bathyalis TaxID=2710756 RepID=A0A7T1T673_9ACTN|nr:hypothetical protein [Streptomyces bathyalis]QPP07113.1 hypothetical protein G4Z16_12765 [Streptomyces bathyalis]